MMGGSIELGRHLPVSAARVWEALVDPAQVGTWLAARATITAELGGPSSGTRSPPSYTTPIGWPDVPGGSPRAGDGCRPTPAASPPR